MKERKDVKHNYDASSFSRPCSASDSGMHSDHLLRETSESDQDNIISRLIHGSPSLVSVATDLIASLSQKVDQDLQRQQFAQTCSQWVETKATGRDRFIEARDIDEDHPGPQFWFPVLPLSRQLRTTQGQHTTTQPRFQCHDPLWPTLWRMVHEPMTKDGLWVVFFGEVGSDFWMGFHCN